jgi:site-specific DNA-cytosine methylase
MLEYSKKHRVKMIILENVLKAPWKAVEAKFDEAGYGARFVRLDTKKYYIPHTRTRGCEFLAPLSCAQPAQRVY